MAPNPPKKVAGAAPEQPRKPQLDKLAELESLSEMFAEAPAVEFGVKMPDGIYQVTCVKTVMARSKGKDGDASGGHPQIRITYKVMVGPLKTREFPQFFTLKDADGMSRFKGWLKSCGYPHATLPECDASLRAMESDGRVFELELVVRKATSGPNIGADFQNINFRKVVDSAADEAQAAELAAEGIDEEGAAEAEAPPKVQHNAKNAPAVRRGKTVQDDDLIGDLL